MSRFCEECGTPLEPNENFCSNCGAKVIRDEPPQPTYTPPVNQPSPQPTYTPPKSTPVESTSQPAENKTVNFLVLIGILVFLCVGAYFVGKPNTDPKPYNTSWMVNNVPPNYQGVLENGYACGVYIIDRQKSIHSNYQSKTANGRYYIVTFILENKTSKPTSMLDLDIVLVDERDNEYAYDYSAGSLYNVATDFYNVSELQPNQPVFYRLVFDIPTGVNITKLRFKTDYNSGFYIPFRVATN